MSPAVPPSTLIATREELAAVLGDEAASTWLVGGVVRDALLARPLLDIDLATTHDPASIARRIASVLGGAAFALGDEFGCWRVTNSESADPSHTMQYDVCRLRGDTIEDDLAARDFTANALALPLTGDAQLLDIQHGLTDIHEGRVRMVATRSLDADPLRMLRAARIAHLLDWDIDSETMRAIRARANRATEPAGERTFAELRLLLLHPEARRGWRLLEHLGLDTVLLPELEICRGVAQSRFHHLDVHDHTLAVLDNCEDLLAATDFWLPLPAGSGLVAAPWSEQQRLTILLAALSHDLGKPGTRAERPDGRVSFVGHDNTGTAIVDTLAERWRWSGTMRQHVRHLVGTHLQLGYLLHGTQSARERWRLRRALDPVVAEAVVLSVGDRLATAGPDDRRRWVRSHLTLAREIWADHWREVRDGIPVPLLDGRELAEAAGIDLGPDVGRLVRALAEAQAVGAVTTRERAIELAREHADVSESTARSPSPGR